MSMSVDQVDEFNYMAEEGEMSGFTDDMDEDNHGEGGADYSVDEYDMLAKITDTSAAQV